MAYCYFTFPSTYYALKAEKKIQEHLSNIPFKMVPVPRRISSSCGTALRCSPDNADVIQKVLLQQQIEFEGKHFLQEEKLNLKDLLKLRKG